MSDSDSDDSTVDGDGIGAILPIQQQDVHRIVSGQVISDMGSAVKELVDNALDAGATSINIRLFNQGIDIIEVSDDGRGIPKHSRPLVAMKHATSKIISFDDLYKDVVINGQVQLNQLGFRGEALFSLVQISQNLIVCTRTESEKMAQQIQFNRDGYLDPNSVKLVPRPKVGTTVAVVKLFDRLPVRRTDMIKRLKTQRAKLLKLMQAYAVLCVGVKFNVYDMLGPGYTKKVVKMSTTEKSKSIKETISSVFGSQFLAGLCMVRVDLSPVFDKALNDGDNIDGKSRSNDTVLREAKKMWRIEGMVSNAPNSNNRYVSREIQFFSVNGRPVDLPKVSRLLNDVWRNYESTTDGSKKRPACILGLYLPNSMFDVNVAPDKREVFISDDDKIYDLLCKELQKIWASQTEGKFVANLVEKESNTSKNTIFTHQESGKIEPLEAILLGKAETKSEPVADEVTVSRSHKRMRRRNAFVNSFSNIGSATTDDHCEASQVAYRNHKSDVSEIDADVSTNPGKSDTSPHKLGVDKYVQKEVGASEKRSYPNKETLHASTSTSASPFKRMRNSAEYAEKQLWNQTKLSFSSSGLKSSQLEEINDLKTLQSKSPSTHFTRTESPKKQTSMHNFNQKNEMDKKVAQQHTQLNPSLEEGPFPNGNNDDFTNQKTDKETDTHKKIPILENSKSSSNGSYDVEHSRSQHTFQNNRNGAQQDAHLPPKNQLPNKNIEREKVRPLQNSLCINPLEPSSSFDTPILSDLMSPARTTSKVTPTPSTALDPPHSTSDLAEQENADKKEDNDNDTIVWNSFQSTANVIEKANTAYVEIMQRRKTLKQIKSSRTNINNNADDGDNLSTEKDNIVKLSKEDFLLMRVVGQFNHGFILALSENGHLWILDQHACDEQYNFERLVRETKIHEQKLIKPLPLELSPSEENCILENMDIFEQNGFRFHYDETKSPRNRLSLTALPHSGSGGDGRKAVQFGKEDVGALCAILGADGASSNTMAGSGTGADGNGMMGNNAVRRHAGLGNGEIIRLPKSIAMFASRACRSSIMIGEALSEKKMEEVVKRLHNVEQPWTCPHGRPTIRHIRDLLDDFIQDEKTASNIVAGEFAALSQVDSSQEYK